MFPQARAAIKYLVADGRYDYIETGSLISIKKNATKLNFVDVFEVADVLYNGEYYIAPYCIAWDLGTAQHQTLGFWMKSDHVLSISTVRLGYGSAPNFADASNISCNYNLTTAQTLSASGEIAGTTATMIVKITPYTIN